MNIDDEDEIKKKKDDEYIFCFQDMEKFGYKAYWVSLKLRTRRQKNVFSFIFDHPGCVLGDIREGLDMNKDTIMPILRGLNERGVLIIELLPHERSRHYSINYQLVEQILDSFRQRIYRMFPEAKEYDERKKREQEEKARLEAEEQQKEQEKLNNPEELSSDNAEKSEIASDEISDKSSHKGSDENN